MRYLIPVAILFLSSCGKTPTKTEAAGKAAPIAVKTLTAAMESWPATYEATGTVKARTASVISAKVMGYVREVHFQVGDRVREGQLLAVLDARDLEANYARAEAGIREASAAIPEVENAIAAARANMDLAQATFRRMDDLYKKKSISNQEFDEVSAKLKAAQAAHEMAVAKRSQLEARIAQAEQERSAAGVMRGYARIAAPFAGVVTAKQVEPGILATPGAPLLTIEREGAYRLEAAVDESRLGSIRTGQPVTVKLDAIGREISARVAEIVPAVDAASRAYVVKIDLPAAPQIRSGLFGRAVFPMGSRQVLAVPAGAVIEHGQLQSVMVADNGVVRLRLVTAGFRDNSKVEILSGLHPGEQLVFPLSAGLTDGAQVEVRP